MRSLRLVILFTLLLSFNLSEAMAGSEFLIRPITLDHGLSQSSVRCVLRDKKGYLWIGTDYGLNRYDNNKVSRYFFDNSKLGSITDHQVEFLVLDSQGDLLAGLAHGLVRYDYLTDSFQEITDQGKQIDARSAINTTDGVLIGGYGKLYYYDSADGSARLLPTKGGSTSAYMSISKSIRPGQYILQTRWDGLWLYNSSSSTINKIDFCRENSITSTLVDSKGNIWIAPFEKGLFCYDTNGQLICDLNTSNSQISSNIIHAIAESEDNIWIGSEEGIDIVNPKDFSVTHLEQLINGPKNCTILCLSVDQSTTIYAGTLRHGVLCIYRVPMRTFTNIGGEAALFGFTTTSIIPDNNSAKAWIGLDGEGIALFDPIKETLELVPGTEDMKVTSLAYYDENHIIAASYNSEFILLNTKSRTITPAPDVFKKIKELSMDKAMAVELYKLDDGRILSVSDQLYTIDPNRTGLKEIPFKGIRSSQEKLNPIYFNGKILLVNDKHNIYKFTSGQDICEVIFSVQPQENITAATSDSKGNLWIATNRSFQKFNINTGLTKNFKTDLIHNITSLALEENRVWIGADNQLFLSTPDDAITVFGPNDGMAPNQFINKAELLTGDYLLLGGVNGLLKINRSDIDQLLSQPSLSEISLSNVIIDNKRCIVNNEEVTVPNSHSIITINIIDHDNGGVRNKLFKYNIEGPKRDFSVETFDRSITLNTLPPGNYSISVSYSLNNGEWAHPTLLLHLHVESPIWVRWWAIAIYVLIFFGILVGGYLYAKARRRRRIEEMHQNALEDKVHFLTHLHSQLRTPLTLILSPLNNLIDKVKKSSSDRNEPTLSTLEDIYHNSIEMRNIIEALPEHKDFIQFKSSSQEDKSANRDINISPEGKECEEDTGLLKDFDTSKLSAILIEENDRLRPFILSHLQSLFKNVEISKSTQDALLKIKDMHPDIIIADVDLQDENGYDFCREIKNTPALCHIPVILLTSGNSLGQKRKCYAYGADSYISKPFDIEMLITRCKNLLLNRTIMRKRYEKTTPADTIASKAVTNSDESFILQLNQILADNLSNPDLGVEFLLKRMLISRTAFYQRMKLLTGKSIGQYISDYRLVEAKKMLKLESLSINEIAEALGFSSQRYFSTFFKDKTGMSPTEFRNSEAK